MVVSSLKKKTATSNNNNNTNRQTAKVKKRVRIQVSSDQYDERNKKDDEYQEAREPTNTFTNDPFSSSEDPSWLDYFSSWNLDAVLPRHDEQQEHHQPNREEEQRQDQVDGTNNNDNDIHQRTRRIQDDNDQSIREPMSLPSCRRRRRNSLTPHSTPTSTTTTTTSTTSNLRSDIRNPLKCLLCFSAKPPPPQDDNDNEPQQPQSRPRRVPISKSNNSKNQLSRLPWQGAAAANKNNNHKHTAESTTSLFRRRPSLSDHSIPNNNKTIKTQTRQASSTSNSTTTCSSSSTSSSGVRYTDHATTTTTTTRQEDDTLSCSLDDTDDWSDASLTWMPLFANDDEAASATSFSLTASPTYYREQYDLCLPLGYRRTLQRQRQRATTDEDATTRVTTDFYSKHCLLVHGGMDDDEYDDDYDEYNHDNDKDERGPGYLSSILSDMMRLDSLSSSSTKRTTPATARTNMQPRRNSLLATTTDQRDAPSKDPSTPWVTL